MRLVILILLAGISLAGATRELTLTTTVDGEKTTIHLKNVYDSAATAWIVECHGETDPGKHWTSLYQWSDEELGLQGKPIPAGGEFSYPVKIPPVMGKDTEPSTAGKCQDFHVMAAVFADGSVTGELRWINVISGERAKVYQDFDKAAEILKKSEDPEQAIKELTEWQSVDGNQRRRGKPGPNYGESFGSSRQEVKPGRTPNVMVPNRPFSTTAVRGATLWLVQEKKTPLPEAIQTIAEWKKRLESTAVGTPPRAFPIANGMGGGATEDPQLVGKPAPEFALKDVDGNELALKDLRGKTVLVNFWATWCEPCRKEMPSLKSLHDEFKDKGLVIVAINFGEDAATARKYFADEGYPFHNLLDPGSNTIHKYGTNSIPKVILVDKDGIVRLFERGYSSRMDFRAEVLKLGL